MTTNADTTTRIPGAARERYVSEFTELARQVQEAGLLKRRYGYYWAKLVGMVALFVALVTVFIQIGDSWWQLPTAVVAAIVFTQAAFLGHDAAHRQIFVSGKWNEWASLLLANLLVGISYGWWQHKHTRHHANPNKVGSDPDIDMPVLAFTPAQAAARKTPLTRWLAARQGWFFFPLLFLEGINLHINGLKRVFGRDKIDRRWVEISLLMVRLGGYLALVLIVLSPLKAVVFLAIQLGLFGFYMGASFAPNHKGMPIVEKSMKLDFLSRQVLTSRNVTGGRFVDTALGGLNYQVEHHLFPSMPRPSLRKVQPIVKAYCEAKGVSYTETTVWRSWAIVVQYLNRVGLGDRDPFNCPVTASYRTL